MVLSLKEDEDGEKLLSDHFNDLTINQQRCRDAPVIQNLKVTDSYQKSQPVLNNDFKVIAEVLNNAELNHESINVPLASVQNQNSEGSKVPVESSDIEPVCINSLNTDDFKEAPSYGNLLPSDLSEISTSLVTVHDATSNQRSEAVSHIDDELRVKKEEENEVVLTGVDEHVPGEVECIGRGPIGGVPPAHSSSNQFNEQYSRMNSAVVDDASSHMTKDFFKHAGGKRSADDILMSIESDIQMNQPNKFVRPDSLSNFLPIQTSSTITNGRIHNRSGLMSGGCLEIHNSSEHSAVHHQSLQDRPACNWPVLTDQLVDLTRSTESLGPEIDDETILSYMNKLDMFKSGYTDTEDSDSHPTSTFGFLDLLHSDLPSDLSNFPDSYDDILGDPEPPAPPVMYPIQPVNQSHAPCSQPMRILPPANTSLSRTAPWMSNSNVNSFEAFNPDCFKAFPISYPLSSQSFDGPQSLHRGDNSVPHNQYRSNIDDGHCVNSSQYQQLVYHRDINHNPQYINEVTVTGPVHPGMSSARQNGSPPQRASPQRIQTKEYQQRMKTCEVKKQPNYQKILPKPSTNESVVNQMPVTRPLVRQENSRSSISSSSSSQSDRSEYPPDSTTRTPPLPADEEPQFCTAEDCKRLARLSTDDILKPDDDGDLYLHITIARRDRARVQAYLFRCEREKITQQVINWANKKNQTPLSLAIASNQHQVVEMLIRRGVDVNKQYQGRREGGLPMHFLPIHKVVDHGQPWLPVLMQLLRSPNLDLNAVDSEGRTPLIRAIYVHGTQTKPEDEEFVDKGSKTSSSNQLNKIDSLLVIYHLIAHGANLNKKDGCSGKTPLHCVIEKKDNEFLVWFLRQVSQAQALISLSGRNLPPPPSLKDIVNTRTNQNVSVLELALAGSKDGVEQDCVSRVMILLNSGAELLKNGDTELKRKLSQIPEVCQHLREAGLISSRGSVSNSRRNSSRVTSTSDI